MADEEREGMERREKGTITIVEFFDPKNIEHLTAFQELQNNGIWPLWFWNWIKKEGVTFPPSWQAQLAFKIADEYLKEKLDEREDEKDQIKSNYDKS